MEPELARSLQACGQEQLLESWRALPEAGPDRARLLAQLQELDLERAVKIFRASVHGDDSGAIGAEELEPVQEEVHTVAGRSAAQEQQWRAQGFQAIAHGRLAVLLLAGGQGTRLGSSDPKGCYNIGLPSGKSLFQLQAERLLKVQQLCQVHAPPGPDGARPEPPPIPWYIMTSPFTHGPTLAFFQEHSYFGLRKDQVRMFQQGTLPCFTPEGGIILETPSTIAGAPDGNGGVYAALKSSGCLEDMKRRGVQHVECFSVDNALVRVADPVFLGFCLDVSAPCSAKVLQKAYPEEGVGLFARRHRHRRVAAAPAAGAPGDKTLASASAPGPGVGARVGPTVEVVEYSEIPPSLATSLDPGTGALRYNWSNVCMHMFSIYFLETVTEQLEEACLFHVAKKKIPSKDGPVEGVKLEQFIFDVFPLASAVALYEVRREEEFSPVKNAPGSANDSPDTARRDILKLHAHWVEAAGGRVEHGTEATGMAAGAWGVEVSPLRSYTGEGLEEVCQGRVYPCLSQLD